MKTSVCYLLSVLGLMSCDTNNSPVPNSPSSGNLNDNVLSVKSITQKFVEGSEWRISIFTEDGTDYSDRMSECSFFFEEDSRLTVKSDRGTAIGTYIVFRDDNTTEFGISIMAIGLLQELNDDWYVISATENTIAMVDGEDQITWQKQ